MPTHMGIWDKWILGWADPLILEPGDAASATSRSARPPARPRGTQGRRAREPAGQARSPSPRRTAATSMWWSNNDQDWADVRLARTVDVPAGAGDARFWMWNDYTIEEDWDFGFVEVSTDGGATWTEQKVYDEAGAEVTTPDGYADPNGRMADFGGKKYGLTGDTGGWQHHYVDLDRRSPAGPSRCACGTPRTRPSSSAAGSWTTSRVHRRRRPPCVADDAEANNGWTTEVDTFVEHHRRGLEARRWHRHRRPLLHGRVAQHRRVRRRPAVRVRQHLHAGRSRATPGAWRR